MTKNHSGFTASAPVQPENTVIPRRGSQTGRLKNAPNVRLLPKDKFTEAVIFAGADAYAHAQHWTESEGRKAGDTLPPVYLGRAQLAELDRLRIIDTGRRHARVYLAGKIEPLQINAIGEKLALCGVVEARLFRSISDIAPENWRDYLARIREQAARGESLVSESGRVADKRPPADELAPCVEARADGLYWITPRIDKQTGELTRPGKWLCDPVEVAGIGSDGAERFLVLRWTPAGAHQKHTEALPMREVGEREGWARLRAGGLSVTAKGSLRATLADYLLRSGTGELWHITDMTGWQYGAYIMPDGEITGTPHSRVLFNGRSAAAGGYRVRGTAQSWREQVAGLVAGNPSMMLGVAAALAAPLVGLAGADGFGVHFFQQSSAGKTTTASIATSLYGDPDALRLTWYGTALGIANEALAHNDALMPLDEVGQGSNPRDVATSAYTLFNGVGKLQGAKDGGNRALKRWRTVAVSTGEMDMETFLISGGLIPKAGQLVRLLNVPLEKATVFHGLASGQAHADALRRACQQHHGAAGREWIAWLAAHPQDAGDAVAAASERWRGLIPADYGEQVHRVAERFAVMEAALLLARAITGWSEQESRDAIQHGFNAWVREFGTGNREHRQIIEQTEAFLNAHGRSRYAPLPWSPQDLPVRDLAGYRDKGRQDSDPLVFYTFPATFENEIAAGFNPKQFARVLAEARMLEPGTDRYKKKAVRVDGRQPVFYVLMYQPEDGGE